MIMGKSTFSSSTVFIRCNNLQKVESFVYLGTEVNSDGGVMMEIKARCSQQMLFWHNEPSYLKTVVT